MSYLQQFSQLNNWDCLCGNAIIDNDYITQSDIYFIFYPEQLVVNGKGKVDQERTSERTESQGTINLCRLKQTLAPCVVFSVKDVKQKTE